MATGGKPDSETAGVTDGDNPADPPIATDPEVERIKQRYRLGRSFVVVLWIAAFALPIGAVQPIARDLAGENTRLGFTLSITIGISIACATGTAWLVWKNHRQRQVILGLRSRCAKLEAELGRTDV